VKSRWNDEEAAAPGDDLDMCVYASRLLGADTALVLSGGGNSSVKKTEVDVYDDPVDVLHVKGSGWDMGSIERAGFAPLRLDRVARLADLPELPDSRMANELKAASLDVGAPVPSVESILHANLPFKFVLHTHADAVLALTNTPNGRALVDEVYGTDVVVVPYVMPGFVLARVCAERFAADRHERTVGMVLLNHGLFTFAHDARTAYENHIDLVGRALARVEATGVTRSASIAPPAGVEAVVAGLDGGDADIDDSLDADLEDDPDAGAFGAGDANAFGSGAGVPGRETGDDPVDRVAGVVIEGELGALAMLRRDISAAAGHPMVLRCATSDAAPAVRRPRRRRRRLADRPRHPRPRAAHQARAARRA
jgi:rhamnose utilization protein RhaD (predicted bifunctional aldolase and dehydrogenase)